MIRVNLVVDFERNVLAKEMGIKNFRAGHGWIVRFFARYDLAIRRKMSISHRPSATYKEKIMSFQKYGSRLLHQNSYISSQIRNADQMPVYFEMPLKSYIRREKNLTIRSGGNEKQSCTKRLCVMADGRKLSPCTVLKSKTFHSVHKRNKMVM
jgi:hypothetical protein